MRKKLRISVSMWVLVIYMCQIVLTDNLMYFGSLQYPAAFGIALIIGIAANVFLFKSGKLETDSGYHKWDVVFYMILLVAVLVDIGFADTSFDTYMYHIYLQENPFGVDKIHSDFFPGRTLTSFVFALADRCFYPFRHLLGFRLGTLPSYLIMIPMFYGVKRLLRYLIPEMSKKALSLYSICPLCSFVILYQLGGYMIDNFSIVVLLEITVVVLTAEREVTADRKRMIYLALLTGLAIGVKYINAILLIGLFLSVLITEYRSLKQMGNHIKWYDPLLWIMLVALPMLPYITDCMRQTGSPVFPYYNTIFRSPYFADMDWLDRRYGPVSALEFLIWPLYIILNPTRANDFKNGLTDFSFAAGYVIIWIIIGRAVYGRLVKKQVSETDKKMLFFAVILLYEFWAWEKFMIGYVRYGGIILIMSASLLIRCLYEGILKKDRLRIAAAGLSLTASVLIGAVFFCIFGGPRYYAGALIPKVASVLKEDQAKEKIVQSFTCIWNDRKPVTYDIDGVWGVAGADSLSPTLLNADDPIVHLQSIYDTGNPEPFMDAYRERLQGKNIYVPLYENGVMDKTEYLESYGFRVKEIVAVLENVPFLQGGRTVEIARVEPDF